MSTIQRWEYPAPTRYVRPNAWARDWRRRWFRQVGTVVVHQATGKLTLLYSSTRRADERDALRAELEGRPNGPALVYAECRRVSRAWNRRVEASNARLTSAAGAVS